jgi:hypothetical protein
MSMQMRRFARLTNAFSKKLENHVAAISLHYNFVRIHQTLRPAMAGVSDHVWKISDIVALLDSDKAAKRTEALNGSFDPPLRALMYQTADMVFYAVIARLYWGKVRSMKVRDLISGRNTIVL